MVQQLFIGSLKSFLTFSLALRKTEIRKIEDKQRWELFCSFLKTIRFIIRLKASIVPYCLQFYFQKSLLVEF